MLQVREASPGFPGRRRCSRCGDLKPIDEFPMKDKARALRRVWCRDCCRAYGREHYLKNRAAYLAKSMRRRESERPKILQAVREYLQGHPCIDCGETDVLLLDFDHRHPDEKRGMVSRIARSATWSMVLREIEKCDVRCANCHRRRTAAQLHWRKDPARGALAATAIAQLGPRLTRPSATGSPAIEQLSIWSVGQLKRCYGCGELKAPHEFALRNRASGERQGFCRPCQAAYRRGHYRRNRTAYVRRAVGQVQRRREEQVRLLHDYLRTHPCVDCSEDDIRVLEFDHADRSEKVMSISVMLGRRSWSTIVRENRKM